MTDEPLDGYLNRMSRNIHALDENIEDVRKAPKDEKPAEKRARLKLLRDMIELQNTSLLAVKTHLLGRDETGAPVEPPDNWEGDANAQIEFERYFNSQLSPWTRDSLKVKCVDCGVEGEEVSGRELEGWTSYFDLCGKCYEKRKTSPKILECEECHVKSEEVSHRKSPGHWIGDILFDGNEYDLCNKCYDKRTTKSYGESEANQL